MDWIVFGTACLSQTGIAGQDYRKLRSTIPCSCKEEGYCESPPLETPPCTDMREAMIVLDFPPFRSMCTLLRSFVHNLADAHDVFARDRTVRMNLLYVLGVTILAGVLNWLFRSTPAMPTGTHLVVALVLYPLMWGVRYLLLCILREGDWLSMDSAWMWRYL